MSANAVILLARTELTEAFEQFGRRSVLFSGLLLLVLAALIIGGLAIQVRIKLQERKQQLNDHRQMFLELCAGHQLSQQESDLLGELARGIRLDEPDRLFVRPDLFAQALDRCRDTRPEITVRELDRLGEKVFGPPADDKPQGAGG